MQDDIIRGGDYSARGDGRTNNQVITFRRMGQFTGYLFDAKGQAKKAALILKAILDSRSPRLSCLSQKMPGSQEANYKAIQRFLSSSDPIYACGSKEQRARNTMLHAPHPSWRIQPISQGLRRRRQNTLGD
jgi:hypothetical protein